MIRKITTLLILAAMIVSMAMPAASAAECNNNNVLGYLNTNQDAKAMLELLNDDTCDQNALKETILTQLKQNGFDKNFADVLNNACITSADLDAATLNVEQLMDMVKAEVQPVNSTCQKTEVPPAATTAKDVETKAQDDEMSLTTPNVDVKADAEPIPTTAQNTVEPIPTEQDDAKVVPVATSTPKVAVTPAPTVAPTAMPEATATPEPTPAPTATAAPAATQKPSENMAGISSIEKKMVDMVNEDRAAAGLAPLAIDIELTTYARYHSQDMSDNNFFSHTSPTNGSFSERLRNSGIGVRGGGENIARYGSVEKAQAGLMASDGHRANILGNYTHVGIGIVYNEAKGAYYITQWFGRK